MLDIAGFRVESTEADPDRWLVLLPVPAYPAAAPLFWYTRMLALTSGWSVAAFDPSADPSEATEAAADTLSGTVVLVAKAEACRAAAAALGLSLPGIWFTPLLGDPEIANPLKQIDVPTLVIGSRGDPEWRVDIAAAIHRPEVLQLPDADHNLEVPWDPLRTVELMGRILTRVQAMLNRL